MPHTDTPSPRTRRPWPLLVAGLLLAGLLLAPAGAPLLADEDPEPGKDLGDENVPFAKQVNQAIEQGVNWLLARPDYFTARKNEMAHFGLVKGTRIYGGGTGPQYRHPAGPTALAVYTLLKCGVDPKHQVIRKGFNWLRELHKITEKWDGTDGQGFSWRHTQAGSSYELSVMILALTAKYDGFKKTSASRSAKRKGKLKIRDRDDREWLIEMVEALVERRGKPVEGPAREARLGWRYNVPKLTMGGGGKGGRMWTRGATRAPPHANQDMSSTNLAALALFSAQRFGLKIPADVWTEIIEFTLKHQEEDGPEVERHMPGYDDRYGGKPKDRSRGFVYIVGSPDGTEGKATRSMTACGVCNLLIAREMLSKNKRARKKLIDSGQLKKIDQSIMDGLAWMATNWSTFTNTHSSYGYHIYHLYCVERAMDILGKELIGKRLWYKPGALEILKRQKPQKVSVPGLKKGKEDKDGVFWMTNATHEPKDVLDTCFALLYLKRATKGLRPPAAVTGD
ncbi:MAG: hypothetical protein QNJ90_13435 [Planctomycetota bacterium]|nr:hypothetical protein [Planctomycetota bacterium]